jgi:hypothetical protein
MPYGKRNLPDACSTCWKRIVQRSTTPCSAQQRRKMSNLRAEYFRRRLKIGYKVYRVTLEQQKGFLVGAGKPPPWRSAPEHDVSPSESTSTDWLKLRLWKACGPWEDLSENFITLSIFPVEPNCVSHTLFHFSVSSTYLI